MPGAPIYGIATLMTLDRTGLMLTYTVLPVAVSVYVLFVDPALPAYAAIYTVSPATKPSLTRVATVKAMDVESTPFSKAMVLLATVQ
jgi:hypothetical protein